MFPLLLSVRNGDYSSPMIIPIEGRLYKREHPKNMVVGLLGVQDSVGKRDYGRVRAEFLGS